MDELLRQTHSRAYWRVVVRPSTFDPKRIPTLGECKQLLSDAQVALRGWDYPALESIRPGGDHIEGSCAWDVGHYEYWRLYRSGQFVHHFACAEEFWPLRWMPAPERYLLVSNTLYTMTEIFEFAARLAAKGVLGDAAEFLIRLHGMAGRELTMDRPLAWPRLRGQVSTVDVIEHQASVRTAALLGEAAGLALAGAIDVFEGFGWLNPPREHLAEQQRKFLERRLGT